MRLSLAVLIFFFFASSLLAKPSVSLVKAYKQAFKEFTANQNSPQAIMKLALASFDAGYFKQSYDLVLQYLEINPDDAKALILYSNILIEYGYEEKARRKLSYIIDLYPGSEEAQKAQKSVDMLDRLHNRIQKQFSFKASGGIDSNPSHLIGNDYLAIFSTTLNCDNNNTATNNDCDYMNRFDDTNSYVNMQAKSNHVYDVADTGGFFLTYGWGIASKMYTEEIDAGYLSFHLNGGFGYSWGKSSFRAPFTVKDSYTKFKFSQESSRFDYTTFNFKPHYRHRLESKALFLIGLNVEDQETSSQFTYNGYNVNYQPNQFFAFLQFQSSPSSNVPFSVMFYRGDQSNEDDYGDYNNSNSIPYSRYNFSGINLKLSYKTSPQKEYKASLELGKKWFDDHHIPNTYPILPGEERIDNSAMFDFQSISVNNKLSKTVLGYKFYTNESNYKPLNFSKHELYIAYYWLP